MACMEHECLECGRVWFDNNAAPMCGRCGGRVSSFYDGYEGADEPWDDRDDRPEDIDADIRECLLEDGGAEIFD